MSSISVVVPSWNTRELLRECLQALARSQGVAPSIVVVDNASSDASAELVEREFPAVRLVRNACNEGFARACNQGLALDDSRFVLLLNADTRVAPDAIAQLASFLDQHCDYAAAAPQLVDADGTTQHACMRFPRLRTALAFATPWERWFPASAELRRYFCRNFDHQHDADVEQPPAACLLVRRAALESVGRLDESLPLYFNDVDLSLRLSRAGWKTRFVATASCVHHVGRSTRQRPDRLLAWHTDRLTYYRKHFGLAGGACVKAAATWSALDFCARQLVARREPVVPVWRALRALLAS